MRARLLPVAVLAATMACVRVPPPAEPREEPPQEQESQPPRPGREEGQVEVGLATYYGRHHHGKETASGDRYDMHAMTCAHRHHPFGAWLRVTELETGRSVLVRVNDRGPFGRGRVVDLSYEAARRLGMLERGVVRVRVKRVR